MNHSAKLRFVELDRFDKELEELRVHVFERLFEACEIARFTPEEKLEYEHDMMTERDYTNILNTYRAEALAEGEAKGFSDGEAKGRAEGLTEGEVKGKMEVARAMKAKGLGMALISELTGLPEEEIRKS